MLGLLTRIWRNRRNARIIRHAIKNHAYAHRLSSPFAPLLVAALLWSTGCWAQSPVPDEQAIRNSIAMGALAFSDNCQACHQPDGYGEEGLYPSLHRPELLADRVALVRTILHGRVRTSGSPVSDEQRVDRLMPSFEFLSNDEIASIVAFITNSWSAGAQIVTSDEVESARSK